MAKFRLEYQGKKYDVEAPDQDTALNAFAEQMGIQPQPDQPAAAPTPWGAQRQAPVAGLGGDTQSVSDMRSALMDAHDRGDLAEERRLSALLKQVDTQPQNIGDTTLKEVSRDSFYQPGFKPLDEAAAFATNTVSGIPVAGPPLEKLMASAQSLIHNTLNPNDIPISQGDVLNTNIQREVANPKGTFAGDVVGNALPYALASRSKVLAKLLGLEGTTASRLGFGTGSQFAINTGDNMTRNGESLPEAATNAIIPTLMTAPLSLLGGGAAKPTKVVKPDEFGIPLTRGQASGDLRQLTKEEMLRQRDGNAQKVIRDFDQQQRDAIIGATDSMGTNIGGNAEDMFGSVTGGLQDKVAFSKQRASALYKIAEDGDLVIASDAVRELPNFVKQRVMDSPIIMDATVTPTAVAAYKLIEEAGATAGTLNTSIKGIEQIRKRLVGLSGSSPEDRAATKTVKKAFDDWLDDSIDKALFSGDETAIDALKAARAESKNYLGITAPKSGDAAGAVIKKMEKGDVTAEQASNWLYGADIVTPNGNAPLVAWKLKLLLGPKSEEWAAVRAMAWRKLVFDMGSGEVRSPTMLVKRLDNFLNNKGTSLSNVLFTEEERNRMKALSATLKRTITPADARNPSRSGYTMGNIIGPMFNSILAAIGFTQGGIGGLAAAASVPIFRNAAKVNAARAAIRPRMVDGPMIPGTPGTPALPSALAMGLLGR